jgi:hypothetical protein
VATCTTITNPNVTYKIIFGQSGCKRDIIGVKVLMVLILAVTCRTVTVIFVLQFKAINLGMPWPTAICAVSAIVRFYLISTVLTAICRNLFLQSLDL